MTTAADRPTADRLVTAGGDPELDARLSAALDTYNVAASGMDALPREFTVKAEDEAGDLARDRGCHQVLVSSFTFQAPSFYERHGYFEFGRSESLPVEGAADVHFVKRLD